MNITKIKIGFSLSIFILLFGCQSNSLKQNAEAIHNNNVVKIVGAMRNVMHKGELFGTIDLDTIENKTHLYGLGPLEYLKGEILILDGKGYKSIVINDTSMQVTETMKMKAPFLGYANIQNWTETEFPDSISNIKQLENYLDLTTKNYPRPFLFKLTATVDSATIHIVNLADGIKVSSPEEAHKGQKSFDLKNTAAEMIGFFSTQHQAILTHHDTYVHIHLITDDKQKMGHLEELMLRKGTAKLYLPTQSK
jgi:acetolactate decarboxylase